MARNDLGRQEWTIELTCLQWAFRQLRPDERDYVTKRLKHVLGKRTLKSSWYEKDAAMLRQLVMLCVWGGALLQEHIAHGRRYRSNACG